MSEGIELIDGGAITAVPGFRAAGVACGIKKTGAPDLALVVSEPACIAAAVFTTNKIQSPAVVFDRELLAERPESVEAVVINSGCANAVTGAQGYANAREMARLAAEALGRATRSARMLS